MTEVLTSHGDGRSDSDIMPWLSEPCLGVYELLNYIFV